MDMLFGKIDENKQYYTEDMIKSDSLDFIVRLLIVKEVITKEEFDGFKKAYVEVRNKELIEEMKNFKGKTKETKDK